MRYLTLQSGLKPGFLVIGVARGLVDYDFPWLCSDLSLVDLQNAPENGLYLFPGEVWRSFALLSFVPLDCVASKHEALASIGERLRDACPKKRRPRFGQEIGRAHV